jgi:transposase
MKQKSSDYKLAAVFYFLENKESVKSICNIFNCSERSLYRWIEKYKQNDSVDNKPKEPIAYKVTKEHVQFILANIDINATITIQSLQNLLYEKFDIIISSSHISRIIKNNNISLKKVHITHEPTKRFGKDININVDLANFYSKINKTNIANIICIDETSISSMPYRSKGYSSIGSKCIIKTHSQEVFKKYTAIFAISIIGVIGFKLYEKGGITSIRLHEFLQENILNKVENKTIILDNASSHRNFEIKNLINKNNKVLYTVPYQHYTNAIENFFSVLKSKLHKYKSLTYVELHTDIIDIINSLSPELCKNIINGAYNRKEITTKKKTIKAKEIKKYL